MSTPPDLLPSGPVATLLLAAWVLLALWWLVAMERRRSPGSSLFPGHLYPLLPLVVVGLWALSAAWPPALQRFFTVALLMALWMWGLLTAVWLVGTALRNHSLMDIAYPLAPWAALVAGWLALGADHSGHTLLLLGCATVWSWRLSGYLGMRYLPHGEEARYAKWRQRGGESWWWWSYFQIYATQGVIVWIWTWPMALALGTAGPPSAWAWLGLAACVVGFVFEAGGDWQMHRFRTNPAMKGRVMDQGLWAWCRHPNYFGEAMTWLGYGLFALAAPWGWLGLPAVLMVFWFMNRGSALSMTERYMVKTKPGYADYMARTPAFFPRPPVARRDPPQA